MKQVIFYSIVVLGGAAGLRFLPKKMYKFIFAAYITGFLYFTFLTREVHPGAVLNLTLFKAARRAVTIDLGLSNFLKDLFSYGKIGNIVFEWRKLGAEPILNILLFIPMGYFLPSLFRFFAKHKGFMFFIGLLISLIVETAQLFTRLGWFDIDDLLNNNLGCIIGFIVWYVLLRKKQETID